MEIRITKMKYVFSFFLFFILLVTGICAVDYSANLLMNDVPSIKIFSVAEKGASGEISLFNYKFSLDTTYVKRDMDRLKKTLKPGR